jgi:putative transposase
MAIDKKLIDQLLTDYKKPEDIIGENGLLKQLTKAVLERALEAEMSEHLGYEKHGPAGQHQGNPRNGKNRKTLQGDFGELELETPRDRQARFEPKIVRKRQTRWTGFDDKIVSMYARGMTTREIQGHLDEIYGIEVSPTLISNVTDAVVEEVKQWQNRPLEQLYPIVYLDALMVKVRDEGHIQNKAIYVVLGVNLEGQKEVLGLWVAESEGAKFWLQVLTELKNRGVQDIFIACVDGLKVFFGFFRYADCLGAVPPDRASHTPDARSSRLPAPAVCLRAGSYARCFWSAVEPQSARVPPSSLATLSLQVSRDSDR